MKSITTQAAPRIVVAVLSCAAVLLSTAALASAGAAPAAGAAGKVRVTVYVVNQLSSTVTPISAVTNKPGKAIPAPDTRPGPGPAT